MRLLSVFPVSQNEWSPYILSTSTWPFLFKISTASSLPKSWSGSCFTWAGCPCQFLETSLLLLLVPGQDNILCHYLKFMSTLNIILTFPWISLGRKSLGKEGARFIKGGCWTQCVYCKSDVRCIAVWSLHMHMHGRPDGMAFCKRGVAWPEDDSALALQGSWKGWF